MEITIYVCAQISVTPRAHTRCANACSRCYSRMKLNAAPLAAFTVAIPTVPSCQRVSCNPLRPRWRQCEVRRARLHDVRRVTCTVKRGDWEKFQVRATESFQSAGRFFQTSTGQAVLWGLLLWLLLTGRIGWIFDSFIVLLVIFSVVPIVGVIFLRWWLNRQLVQGVCPSCGAAVTGVRNQPFQCMRCGQVVRGEQTGDFSVNDPSSATIDIDAKRVD